MEQRTLLSARQLAERYGVSKASIYRWVQEGVIPPPQKLGPRVSRWDGADIEAIATSQRHRT
jgi:predicted DNA-binding transcriptional regulator AlpA